MACFHPLSAWQLDDGRIVFAERGSVKRSLQLPCGQCIGCRLERSRQWAVRCVHEAQMHDFSVFVTLTYDDAHLRGRSLCYRDFQLFMKRVRRNKGPVRFYMCGEYGESYGRPHFHACLFGCFFEDRVEYRKLPSGSVLYTSKELANLWPFGFSSIGDVTFESAAYVARYVMKKVTGDHAEEHYTDPLTGECLRAEFTKMSLRPGIGAHWFDRYRTDVFGQCSDTDRVVVRGVEMKPPRYYDRLLERVAPFEAEYKKFLRSVKAEAGASDTTPERLKVREQVARARLSFKKRSLV